MIHLSKIKIQEKMEQNGISTFKELAEKLDITSNQLSIILSEKYSPVKQKINELCDLLNVDSLDDICDFTGRNKENEQKVEDNDVTAIELFAGAGGLALGLEKAGIKTLEYVEIDKACCETLKKNRPKWNVVCDDIHNVDFSKYAGKVDIVTGGFPCQAFSYAGKKMGFNDVRGTLFYEFARCVKEVSPKMFMAENVRGLISHDGGRTLNTIISVFEDLGYKVQYKVLNASYYGVGQKRERIVLIGIRNDFETEFTYPIADKKQTTLKEALRDCPQSPGISYSEKKAKVFKLVPPGGCWVDLPEDVAKEYMGKSYYSGGGKRGMARRISWDEPCLTLTCSPSQKQTDRCHPDEVRPFTVREYARIQSFPDNWTFCGGIGSQYKQIGNAVPVELARRVGVEIVKSINEGREING